MADIELVIKISEEEYEMIVNSEDCGLHTLTRAIAHGTILPKGHGALKDADELNDYFWDNRSRLFHSSDCRIAIDKADTIIEADKEEE